MDTPSIRHANKQADCLMDVVVVKLIEAGIINDQTISRPLLNDLIEGAAIYLEDAHEAGIDYACRAFTEALPRDVRDGMPEDGR